MRKGIVVLAAACILAMAGTAVAGDTTNVTVTATVAGYCRFLSTPAIAFGQLPFDATGNALGASRAGNLTFECSNGLTYTISDDKSGVYNLAFGAETIPYALAYSKTSGTGLGLGTTDSVTLTATIAANSYTGKPAGAYQDTVQVSIIP